MIGDPCLFPSMDESEQIFFKAIQSVKDALSLSLRSSAPSPPSTTTRGPRLQSSGEPDESFAPANAPGSQADSIIPDTNNDDDDDDDNDEEGGDESGQGIAPLPYGFHSPSVLDNLLLLRSSSRAIYASLSKHRDIFFQVKGAADAHYLEYSIAQAKLESLQERVRESSKTPYKYKNFINEAQGDDQQIEGLLIKELEVRTQEVQRLQELEAVVEDRKRLVGQKRKQLADLKAAFDGFLRAARGEPLGSMIAGIAVPLQGDDGERIQPEEAPPAQDQDADDVVVEGVDRLDDFDLQDMVPRLEGLFNKRTVLKSTAEADLMTDADPVQYIEMGLRIEEADGSRVKLSFFKAISTEGQPVLALCVARGFPSSSPPPPDNDSVQADTILDLSSTVFNDQIPIANDSTYNSTINNSSNSTEPFSGYSRSVAIGWLNRALGIPAGQDRDGYAYADDDLTAKVNELVDHICSK